MIHTIRRAWLRLVADWRLLALVEAEAALSKAYPLSDEIPALLKRKLAAQKDLFAAEANLRQMRETDGADYAILVAILVALAWGYVSEADYRDLTATSSISIIGGDNDGR